MKKIGEIAFTFVIGIAVIFILHACGCSEFTTGFFCSYAIFKMDQAFKRQE